MVGPVSFIITVVGFIICFVCNHMALIELKGLWEIYLETGHINDALNVIFAMISILAGTLLGGAIDSNDYLKLYGGGSSDAVDNVFGYVTGDIADDVMESGSKTLQESTPDENGNYRVRIDPPDKKLIIRIYISWMKIKIH